MTYSKIELDKLMAFEYPKVEGGLSTIDQRDLQAILPKGMTADALLEKLAAGEYVLLTDAPITPLLIQASSNFVLDEWTINPDAEPNFQPSALVALQHRLTMGEIGGGSSAFANQNNGNLHPAKPIHYTPEPVVPDSSTQQRQAPLAYEYNIEIAHSANNPNHPINLNTILTDTKGKNPVGKWDASPTKYGTRYTIKSHSNAFHNLNFLATKNTMGLSLRNVEMVTLGSGKVHDAFIPIMPAVQFGERLGIATTGYLYHFKGKSLIQKYQWQDDGTFSPMPDNNSDYTFHHASMALLVYWKIAGSVVKDQYLVYRTEPMPNAELDQVSPEWLDKHGVHLDIDALLKVSQTPILERDAQEKTITKANASTHTVIEDPTTQQRETWPDIAKQYGLSAKELLNQNPHYDKNPGALKIGDTLRAKQTTEEPTVVFEPSECPPEAPSTYNNPHNSHYVCSEKSITVTNSAPVLPLEKRKVKKGLPLVNIKPEHILRIGVFFDGTANNKTNDAYKEKYGDHSRTNIARLFEAYPQKLGESDKIYVSGVGTLDLDEKSEEERKKIIDTGDDMLSASLATGLFDAGSAFIKWQSLLTQLKKIITQTKDKGIYQDITHIAFDVFGFSRGAALARHFINILHQEGLPDYERTRNAPPGRSHLNASDKLHPNLLGSTNYARYSENNDGFHKDDKRSASVRFVGILDTVGSFDWPGNDDEGDFQLVLDSNCAKRVLHITAHGEYRTNFPLTTLKTKGKLPPNFYEEVFPGAHSDVGGGYPFRAQYDATALADVFGSPTHLSYRLELIKIEDISTLELTREDMTKAGLTQWNPELLRAIKVSSTLNDEWNTESIDKFDMHGRVTHDHSSIYYYHLHPIDASLAGLSQERLKQQAELAGIEWNMDKYIQTKDYMDSKPVQALWKKLSSKAIGAIQAPDWQTDMAKIDPPVVHNSHYLATHIGFNGIKETLVNGVKNNVRFIQHTPDQVIDTPERAIYDNI
ncbi:peptidoglycan-binding protein [Marinomonas primoryensis]|uniref:Peptidoglycan-binding protein n=1 Tax=Marinomonas primoryensis TaxID=178399 RepID=A0A2Z4PSD9_9GAMM|nr:DUF2235 domain-containing protein [Marinomonas primoryensis]AWY00466.1 peptidoglycan-binding protein [Marinomonas primoryensis]